MTKPPLGIANIFAPLLVRTFGQVSVKFDNRCCGILRFGRLGAKWLFEARFIGSENRVLKARANEGSASTTSVLASKRWLASDHGARWRAQGVLWRRSFD